MRTVSLSTPDQEEIAHAWKAALFLAETLYHLQDNKEAGIIAERMRALEQKHQFLVVKKVVG